jgi:hypothetical protein
MEEVKNNDENVTKVEMPTIDPAENNVIKVDLTKPPVAKQEEQQDADTEQEAADVVADEQAEALQEVVEEVPSEQASVQNEEPVVEEQVEQDNTYDSRETSDSLPENLTKLVDFMKETGGTVEDYVALNRDYSDMDNYTALQEYYKSTKPHLSAEEINFLMEDSFSFDEEIDDEKEVKRKKLALKEQVANAKAYLDGQKSKYYDEIKARPTVNDEYQKAMDFFNRYNKESEETQKRVDERSEFFQQRTNKFFGDEFKGFDYNVGDKKFRFNVKNKDQVKETQSDINNFVKKFLDKDGKITNEGDYHKSLYTAMNADNIAQHFYEQGKADALKESVAKAKNVDMDPRQSLGSEVNVSGIKYRVLGGNSNSFKIKKK